MFAGIEGRGAADASYETAIALELAKLENKAFVGGAADVYKCFDQVQRGVLGRFLRRPECPKELDSHTLTS